MVGIHDVFLPWDYPPSWNRRWYGEQFLLAAALLAGPSGWAVDFPAWYVQRETDLASGCEELWRLVGDPPGATSSALWLERS